MPIILPETIIRSTIPQMKVRVNGQDLPQDAANAILEGVIESTLHLPDACSIRIHDHEFKWLDSDLWKEGNSVMITAGQGRDPLRTIFEGEITTIELDLAGMGVATMTVRCMDKAHRLHRGKRRETYANVKDSDIVSKIAQRNGLQADIDATPTVHEWVFQSNQTDWEFLQMLANRNGSRVYLEGADKLCFKIMRDADASAVELEWGQDLRSFRIRVSSSNQVNKVIVRSWDPIKKRAIIGQATTARGAAEISQRGSGAAAARQAFGDAEMVVVDHPVHNEAQARSIAQSLCDEIGTSFVEADGLCYNHPGLSPGDTVELKNIGKRFNGKYIVTSTTHTFSAAEGFATQFVISGKNPATLLSILRGGR